MKTLNRATIMGYVGGDPELKKTTNEISKVNLSVATAQSWKPQGQDWKTETQWHRVVFWAHKADYVSEKIRKGDLVYVEGKIKTYEYTAEDNTVRVTEIHADDIIKVKDTSNKVVKERDHSGEYDELPF